MATTSAIDRFLHAIENAAIAGCDAWSTDAVLDATVPNWRLRAVGSDAIRAEYGRWFADRGSFGELRRMPVPGVGELVEYTLSWSENGVRSRLTSITGMPSAMANSGSPAAGYTAAEVPTTIATSDAFTASTERSHAWVGNASPNHTTFGRISPPHAQIGGSTDSAGSGMAGSSP